MPTRSPCRNRPHGCASAGQRLPKRRRGRARRKDRFMSSVNVRYIVTDIDAAVAFYADALGFAVDQNPGGGFAVVSRGGLRLFLNQPGAGGAGQAMPDGREPEPGGWNRI